jgi:hypothetical protein
MESTVGAKREISKLADETPKWGIPRKSHVLAAMFSFRALCAHLQYQADEP